MTHRSTHHYRARHAWLVAAVAMAIGAFPGVADAHAKLLKSDPASGAHLDSLPRTVRLWFSEPMQLAVSSIAVAAPGGAMLALGAPRAGVSGVAEIDVDLPPALAAGAYAVRWRSASRDGHPISGSFSFTITAAPDAIAAPSAADSIARAAAAVTTAARAAADSAVRAQSDGNDEFGISSPAYVVIRWLTYAALLIAIGSAIFLVAVVGGARGSGILDAGAAEAVARDARRVGRIAAWALVPIALARLVAQSLAMEGSMSLGSAPLSRMLLNTVWGVGWLAQVTMAILLALVLRRTRVGAAGIVIAALLAFTQSFSGHAVAMGVLTPLTFVAIGVHVLAAAGWLGALFVMMVAGVPVAMRMRGGDGARTASALVNRFSPWAIAFAAALIVTGAISAWVHLGSIAALTSSRYGIVLLIKLAVLAVVLLLGMYHERIGRRLIVERGAVTLRRTAAIELSFAALILAITAVLAVTPPPAEMMRGSRLEDRGAVPGARVAERGMPR
ncbi:MAG: copper resistance protein CopC [Gemmatimonadaceae bacterium]